MKNLTVRIAKLVGTPSASSWSQIHTFFPEDPQKLQKRGNFLVVLTFSGMGDGIEAVALGREILSRLHEEYYGEIETVALAKLTKAVETVILEFSKENRTLEIIAGAILSDVLYLAISGQGEAWVKRDGFFQQVLVGSKQGVENASGFIKPGDILIFGTDSLFKLLPQGVLRAALENEDPEQIVETIAPLIWGKEQTSQVASLIGQVEEGLEPVGQEKGELIPPEKEEVKPAKRGVEMIKRIFFAGRDRLTTLSLGQIRLGSSSEGRTKRMVLSVALLLIPLLMLSLVIGMKKRGEQQTLTRYQSLYQQARQFFEESKSLITLNPVRARELFLRSKQIIVQLEGLKIEKGKTEELKKSAEEMTSQVIKEHKLVDIPLFFDLELIRENGKGERLSLSGKNLLVLDGKENRIYAIDIERKSGEVVAGKDLPLNSSFIASFKDLVYVFGKEGIYQVNLKNKKVETVIKNDSEWQKIVALGAFSGNLYLLDQGKKTIWRYRVGEGSFSARQSWTKEGVLPDLGEAISMAIDGSIWVSNKNGKILKLTQGGQETFRITGLEKSLAGSTVINTNDESKNLYLLDRENKRMVLLSKTGEFQGQYLWDGFSGISDFVVLEKSRKIFLLSGNKILEMDLQ